jgi:hypothetical protein
MLRILLALISWIGAGALYLTSPRISGETMYQFNASAPGSAGIVLLIAVGLYLFYTGLDAVLRRRRQVRRAQARAAEQSAPIHNVVCLTERFPNPRRRQRFIYWLYRDDTDGLNREWPVAELPHRLGRLERSN